MTRAEWYHRKAAAVTAYQEWLEAEAQDQAQAADLLHELCLLVLAANG